MNRRGFIRALAMVPVAAVLPAIAGRAAAHGSGLAPLIAEDGTVIKELIVDGPIHADRLNVGKITAGVIRSYDKRTRVDLDRGVIEIET